MKFYFEGSFNAEPRKKGKLAKVSIFPSTQSRACREIFTLVANEIPEVVSGGDYALGMVGEKKTPMLFPNSNQKTDNRILVMGDIPQPKHRSDGYLDLEKCTAKILDESQGGGAWGAGSCFLAILEDGQRVVSNRLIVWKNEGGLLIKTQYESLSEYELAFSDPSIEFV